MRISDWSSDVCSSDRQQAALEHRGGKGDLAIVVGYAGTGKSAMLGVAREAWEHQGYHVRGAALSGIAAENLEGGSAIRSEEHTPELQSLMRISYAVFCLKKKNTNRQHRRMITHVN